MGVASLKIEGRMKSPHYIATVVSAYRRLIDDAVEERLRSWEFYNQLLQRGENRPTGPGFLAGIPGSDQLLSDPRAPLPSQEFVAIVEGYDSVQGLATLSQRNVFSRGDLLEHFSPTGEARAFRLNQMWDASGNPIERASHPKEILRIPVPWPVEPLDLIRKVE
jgi:putative protease